MNSIQKQLKDVIVAYLSNQPDIHENNIDETIAQMVGTPLFNTLSHDEIEEVKTVLKSELYIKLDRGTLIEEKGHKKWFLSRKSELDMKYWERYKKYLLNDKGFAANVVNSMDDILDTLTDLLGDPVREVSFRRHGLIIGDVQSGKTANYIGLICKAADAGYKVIVLLTGTIEKLRQQTQQRVDEGFVGADSNAMMKKKDEGVIIGAGKYDSSVVNPMVLTSTSDDFKTRNATSLNFDLRNINGPVVFVVKKNSAVLKRLNQWLSTFNQNGKEKINHSLLVIDDEADNASVNTKKNPEDTPTAINGQIRTLLAMFARSSYVGFTATPFANIFIDPESSNDSFYSDLFPKDYIYSLNAPSNYTGARNVFGKNGSANYMLVEINDDPENEDSIASLLPLSHKQGFRVKRLPEDMKTAIESFLLANTLEDLKGMSENHRSMLINVSRFTSVQEHVCSLVNGYLKELQSSCRNYGGLDSETALKDPLIARLKETYEKIYESITVEWGKIQKHLYSSCAGITVQVFNKNSGKNFSYDDYKDGLRVIAVGGMSLSRGLTLEGLIISYFYRNSKMYDTLMQMGRWFGYREKYAELCRIFMSPESISWYSYISDATDELREEVKRYEDTNLTPRDFGLRVRSDITTLLVTATNKMRSADTRECVISLSGETIETPYLYSDHEKNSMNRSKVESLINKIDNYGYHYSKIGIQGERIRYEYHDIPVNFILEFLNLIDISPKNVQFDISAVSSFIKEYKGNELKKWDIAFVPGKSENTYSFSNGITLNYPRRLFTITNEGRILQISGAKTRLGGLTDGAYGLSDEQLKQAASSGIKRQKDYFKNVKRNPLLNIYFVELHNRDGETNEELLDMEKSYKNEPVIGFGIGIPQLANQKTKYARYMLNKIALQQIFDGEYEDDEEDD